MNQKVIYVSHAHLCEKTERDWYINYLIAKNVAVEYWDVMPLIFGDVDEFGSKNTKYLRIPKTYEALEAMLRIPENRDANYVMLVTYEGRTAKLYRLLSKYNVRMLSIEWGAMPIGSLQKWRSVLSGFSDPLRLAEKIFYKLKAIAYRKLDLIKPFDIVFAAGHALMMSKLYATKVIPINLVDYDHYRKVKLEGERLVEGRYAVFLDIYLPYQSDLKICGVQAVKPHEYYASLNRFFELLELKYEIKVVVAAHPKADYSVDLFNGRESYQGRTPELVKDADFVIAHHSTALSYAVLNYKPIIFIYTNEMVMLDKHRAVSYIQDFAGYLDAAIYNIDKITQGDQIIIREINPSRYDDYKYNFLTTHESEHMLTQDIFWREISMN